MMTSPLPPRSPADPVLTGLERFLAEPPPLLRGARFGLLTNQAAVDRQFRYAHRALADRLPGQLVALFGPQHGFWSQQQDNMIETPHDVDPELGIPVYSLYSGQRRPSRDMLAGLDVLVVDLQDVGTRVYTYIWTMLLCLEACAERQLPVLVLDRPNPLGGVQTEGPLLDPAYRSFVGLHPIPMRHGLTMAEMARHFNRTLHLGLPLFTVTMRGWTRNQHWSETGLTWIGPSPNLPRIEGVDVYPGQVLLEGTNLSEGRGTTTPFELFGAPFIDSARLQAALADYLLPGVTLRPVRFEPTFQKLAGETCQGLYLHVTDRRAFRPYHTTLAILACVRKLWPHQFRWLDPPYEYEHRLAPIDILSGGPSVRQTLDRGATVEDVRRLAAPTSNWWQLVADDLLYERPAQS